jgi:dipeptidyl aminopeptidase/acylaminoacyl peptidase
MISSRKKIFVLAIAWFVATPGTAAEPAPDYSTKIAPILKKYCAGCHNDDDAEGKLSLESFAAVGRGGEHGPALQPGDAKASRMIRVLTGRAKPAMPPEDEPRPSAEQIALLAAWIDAGAKGPDGKEPDRTRLLVPKLKPGSAKPPVTSVAYSPDGKLLAVATFRTVEIVAADTQQVLHTLSGHPGKINDLRFTADGSQLIVATGVTGLYGQANIWNAKTGKSVKTLRGHRDTLYVALPSPDGKILATAGYDRRIILWDMTTDKQLHVLSEHNGAVYDLAFTPDGKILASASEDTTVKIWHVASGRRLDTRGEPLKEQYSVAISPDGRYLAAGGADNRVRLWRLVSRDRPRINPLLHARYAHEATITRLRFSGDGRQIVSASLDRSVKVWRTKSLTQLQVYADQSDVAEALAVSSASNQIVVGRMDGSLEQYRLAPLAVTKVNPPVNRPNPRDEGSKAGELTKSTEQEPNDTAKRATPLKAPAKASGVIAAARKDGRADVDLFRFASMAGQKWIIEINAARSKSPLDSKIEVLNAHGKPVPRVVLQAVRDSYFTFRGKDSNTTGDFRLHNWREMSLNQYLYAGGEVVRLYHYPRGPDSGYNVYPNSGKRHGYFGTTPLSHALGAPCYIVEPHPPGETIVPNGLPVFRLNYENDDDSLRKLGADSRTDFIAPKTGEYLVRVRDVRGFGGEKFKYTLTVRRAKPDYRVKIISANPSVPAGAGRRFGIELERIDGFAGDVRLDVAGLPPGFSVAGPLVVEATQRKAWGTIVAAANAGKPTAKNAKSSTITATATINGREVTRPAGSLGEIKLAAKPKLRVTIFPAGNLRGKDGLKVLEIAPGQTVKARLRVERNGHSGVISFGKEEAAWNLPHGVYVDATGLNGVLLLAGQNEREFFITAESWVAPTERPIFLEAGAAEKPTSRPVLLRVR